MRLLPSFARGAAVAACTFVLLLCGCAGPQAAGGTAPQAAAMVTGEAAQAQVRATETAFARSMAERDLQAFARFVADDAVFFSGPTPLHGKDAVVAYWQRFFAAREAPFSWAPQQVEVVQGGSLALSTGPVRDAAGRLIGCYSSIWRQESPGGWRIVFDRGGAPADCETR